MTEHSKIPLPEDGKRSLFEKADDQFGLGSFAPAAVPRDLGAAPNRRVHKTVRKAMIVEETVERDVEEDARTIVERAAPAPAPREVEPARTVTPATRLSAARVQFSTEPQTIDRARLRSQGLIEPERAVTGLLEEFRLVKRQILLAARDARTAGRGDAAQRVLVCSPLPGEGKTFCAVNLALALAAEKDSEVVLVDADFAKPSVPQVLGLKAGPGLMDVLSRPELRVEDCVLATDIPGLFVLPAGHTTGTDSEYLASGRTAEVLARLTQGAPNRMVIFDSPPALAASPASELAGHVGQALVVCRADKTGQSALADALSLLSACPDIKLLLNAANFSPSGRRFGTYYGYGGLSQ
jgi:Mrp family chromosome partitioning ATPase